MHWMPYLGTFKHIFSHSQMNKEVIMIIYLIDVDIQVHIFGK